jgi:predicted lipoprotein with Yx(FWY)xxD motif
MKMRSTMLKIAAVATGLTALVACGNYNQPDAAPAVAPSTVVVTVPATQPATPQQQEPAQPADQQPAQPQAQQPAQQPQAANEPQPAALQRTMGQVKIFDGPAAAPIPPVQAGKSSPAVQVNAGENQVVTDSRGMTLYRFDKDSANPSKPTCFDDCAKKWPPLLVKSPGKIYTVGVDPKIVSYVERPDGTCQVTINGWPAYYFAKDQVPGDILGQGVGTTWFAFNPQGGKSGVTNTGAGSGY